MPLNNHLESIAINQFTADASDMNWRPGHWPLIFDTNYGVSIPTKTWTRVRVERDTDGDVVAAHYRCTTSDETLTVFND
jgi:hypothetical protein